MGQFCSRQQVLLASFKEKSVHRWEHSCLQYCNINKRDGLLWRRTDCCNCSIGKEEKMQEIFVYMHTHTYIHALTHRHVCSLHIQSYWHICTYIVYTMCSCLLVMAIFSLFQWDFPWCIAAAGKKSPTGRISCNIAGMGPATPITYCREQNCPV